VSGNGLFTATLMGFEVLVLPAASLAIARQRVGAIINCCRVPADRIWRGGVFRTQVYAITFELHSTTPLLSEALA